MSDRIGNLFPDLADSGYRVTSPATAEYNCIAWAAGDEENWWWPDSFGDYFWPPDVLREETLDSFVAAFESLGYTLCPNAEMEPGFQKIAIFVDHLGTPTHAARQQPSGEWTSKLGQLEDIEHSTLEALQGDLYGRVGLILRRPSVSSL